MALQAMRPPSSLSEPMYEIGNVTGPFDVVAVTQEGVHGDDLGAGVDGILQRRDHLLGARPGP